MGDSSHSLRTSVHKALGGGQVADVLLWRKWCGGAVMLVSATTMLFRTRYCNVTMSKLSPEVSLLIRKT
ncbi:hypothetical protein HRI_003734600 [Hibiscus trionum]|uniref:Uncharacterized protein n=1 Tax=Hibiscus trionum TaxID=183268 RepID=A0A9W7MG72_HIBTR|nr:hypothetical protein HRI_003734600 [Hibiscus trionum]